MAGEIAMRRWGWSVDGMANGQHSNKCHNMYTQCKFSSASW